MGKIKEAINKATDKVELMDALEIFKDKLQKLGPIPQPNPQGRDIYDYAVKYFNTVVEFQDKYAFQEDFFKKTPEEAKKFAKHLKSAGRYEPYNPNFTGPIRAPRGQAVTLNDIYLGDIYGIWTNTAAFFKDLKIELKEEDKFVQTAIQSQLYEGIKEDLQSMIDLIPMILKNNDKPNNFIVKKALEHRSATK